MTHTKHPRTLLLAIAAGLGVLASSACIIGPKHDDPETPVADTGIVFEDTSTPFDGAMADSPTALETSPDAGLDDRCSDGGDVGDGACADAASDARDASDADAEDGDAAEVTDSVTGG